MNLINEVDKPIVKKTIVVYAGRFQPFHKGHYAAYSKLVSKFGEANVYIGTSNDQSGDKSPFNFREKKEIATKMFGIPSSKFIQIRNPYQPVEILKKFDGKTTAYIAAVGEKDAQRLQGKYFKPYKGKSGYGYDEIGYVYPVPAEQNPISGTDVRNNLGGGDEEKAKKFFLKAYPKFDKNIFNLITSKLVKENFPGGIGLGLNLPNGYINGAPTGSNNNEIYNPIVNIIENEIFEEIFNNFLEGYLDEKAPNSALAKVIKKSKDAEKNPTLDKDISYTNAKGQPAKTTVRKALRLRKDHPAHQAAVKMLGTDKPDAGVKPPPIPPLKGKDEKPATQQKTSGVTGAPPPPPPIPSAVPKAGEKGKPKETPVPGQQPAANGQPAPEPPGKLKGADFKSSAEKDTTDKEDAKLIQPINKNFDTTPDKDFEGVSDTALAEKELEARHNFTDISKEKGDDSPEAKSAKANWAKHMAEKGKRSGDMLDAAVWDSIRQDNDPEYKKSKEQKNKESDTKDDLSLKDKSDAIEKGYDDSISQMSDKQLDKSRQEYYDKAEKAYKTGDNKTGDAAKLAYIQHSIEKIKRSSDGAETKDWDFKKLKDKYEKDYGEPYKSNIEPPEDDGEYKTPSKWDVGSDSEKSKEEPESKVDKEKIQADLKSEREQLSKVELEVVDNINNTESKERKSIWQSIKNGVSKLGKSIKNWVRHKAEMIAGTAGAVKDIVTTGKLGAVKDKNGKTRHWKEFTGVGKGGGPEYEEYETDILDKHGKPTGKKKKEKKPKWSESISEEDKKIAEASWKKSKEQKHHVKHFVKDAAILVGSMIVGAGAVAAAGAIGAGGGAAAAGSAALKGAAGVFSHGAGGFVAHLGKDIAKHAALETLGVGAEAAGVGGAGLSLATGGLLEILNEEESIDNSKFTKNFFKKFFEKFKNYKLSDEQLLKSIQSYKKNKVKSDNTDSLKESISQTKQQSIQHFVEWATQRLKLQEKPKVNLVGGGEFAEIKTSLGGFDPETKEIYVATENRLTADILRTLAHEMVHRKQDEMGLVRNPINDGADGSPIENQAHAVAGILMREYGRINKKIFKEGLIKEMGIRDIHLTNIIKLYRNATFRKRINAYLFGKVNMPANPSEVVKALRGMDYDEITKMEKDLNLSNPDLKETIKKVGDKYVVYPKNGGDRLGTHDSLTSAKKQLAAIEINKEDISIDVEPGDEVLMGKFKNKKIKVKDIGKDTHGMPTINGRQATTFRTINEVSSLEGGDDQPNGAWLPKNSIRQLGGNDGVNKKDNWFTNGGYTQTDFPIADSIYGDEEELENYITYKDDNLNIPNFKKTKFPKSNDTISMNEYQKLSYEELKKLFIDKINKSELITEGGAYGHMSHPFDDMQLTFGELKDIISRALDGELGVVREKTDGQALAISWKNGRLIAARNKGHLANAGANAMGIEDVASKFAGRGGLTDAYNFAMRDLTAAISGLSQKQKEKIFGEGKCFMNLEVIWPESVNVIPYGQALLIFHNTTCYDENGVAVGADQSAARTLAGMIKQVNADVQSKYTIQGPPVTEIPKNENLSSKKGKYLSKLSKLQSKFGCDDGDTMAVYHQHWWENFIDTKAPVKVDKITKEALVRRWAFGEKTFRLNTISNAELQKWAITNDKVNVPKQQKDNMKPFEEIFLGVGADVLEFVGSVLTVHPNKAIRAMKDKLKQVAAQIKTSSDTAKIAKFKNELERLNSLGGINRIVASEGLVFFYNGKTYKLTGTFAPLNQLLGIFYE